MGYLKENKPYSLMKYQIFTLWLAKIIGALQIYYQSEKV
jgi:hypothetical protein